MRRLYERATKGPWAIESCGEKGDGSNMIGVVFGPDDPDAEKPLSGWIDENEWADKLGEPMEDPFYRDTEVAECAHRNGNHNADAEFIAAAYNNMGLLLDVADACQGLMGLVQILLSRDDLAPEIRSVLTTNHRVVDAAALFNKKVAAVATGGQVRGVSAEPQTQSHGGDTR